PVMARPQTLLSMVRELVGFFGGEKFVKVRTEKFGARYACHFFKICIGEDDLGAIVRNNHPFIQCLKNAFDLLQPFRLLDVHGFPFAGVCYLNATKPPTRTSLDRISRLPHLIPLGAPTLQRFYGVQLSERHHKRESGSRDSSLTPCPGIQYS